MPKLQPYLQGMYVHTYIPCHTFHWLTFTLELQSELSQFLQLQYKHTYNFCQLDPTPSPARIFMAVRIIHNSTLFGRITYIISNPRTPQGKERSMLSMVAGIGTLYLYVPIPTAIGWFPLPYQWDLHTYLLPLYVVCMSADKIFFDSSHYINGCRQLEWRPFALKI